MENTILIAIILGVCLVNVLLYIFLGSDRLGTILVTISKISKNIEEINSQIKKNESSATARDSTLNKQITTHQQKLEQLVNKLAKSGETRLDSINEGLLNELRSSTDEIKGYIQHSHSNLAKSFKSKLSDINSELVDLNRILPELKDSILSAQAQSFYSVERTINEGQKNIGQQLKSMHTECTNIESSLQDAIKLIKVQVETLRPIEELLNRLNKLYDKLILLDSNLRSQEKSLGKMVDKHTQLSETTQVLQKTSEDIFDLLKLLTMDSIMQQTSIR